MPQIIAIDLETTGLEATWDRSAKVHCCGFANSKESYLVVGHDEVGQELERIRKEGYIVVAHNAVFDLSVIRLHYGIGFKEWHDTMLMSFTIDTNPQNSLDAVASRLKLEGKFESPTSWDKYTPSMGKYCLNDAKVCWQVFQKLAPQLKSDELAWQFYLNIDLPYQEVLMELNQGAFLDNEALDHLDRLYSRYLNWLESKLVKFQYYWKKTSKTVVTPKPHIEWLPLTKQYYETAYVNRSGETIYAQTKLDLFNPNSTDQAVRYLRSQGVPKTAFKITESGKLSIDKETQIDHPFAVLLAKYNLAKHKYDGFIAPLVRKRDGNVIRGRFNQCRTATHRLSSSDPNLQNIPRRGAGGNRFRQLFIAPPEFDLLVGDLDRIELVVLAYYLEEYGYSSYMADAIRAGDDLHTINRDKWGLPPTTAGRDIAKTVIFALVYGAGDDKLSKTARLSKSEMAETRKAIYAATKLDRFRDAMVARAQRSRGVLHDVMGSRLLVKQVLSSRPDVFAEGQRKCLNYLIQGSAGSIFKELQLRAAEPLQDLLVRTVLVVHDEAVYMAFKDQSQEALAVLNREYKNSDILATKGGTVVPISAEFKVCRTWADK